MATDRRRILHITRKLPPLVGGMERLNWHIADELSHYAQVRLIGPQGSAALRPAAVPVMEVPLRPRPRFLPRGLNRRGHRGRPGPVAHRRV